MHPPSFRLVTQPLAEQVRELLRDRLMSGSIAPSSRLDLEALAAEFGVSITPVRDALRLLERDGLVAIQPRRGVFAAPADVRAFRDVFDARIALECLAVESAVDRIPTIELDELDAVHCAAAARLRSGRAAAEEHILGPIDSLVHDLIVRHCDNAVVRELMDMLRGRIAWVRRVAADQAHRYHLSFGEHRVILAALRARDPDAACRAMREHLTASRDHTLASLPTAERSGAGGPRRGNTLPAAATQESAAASPGARRRTGRSGPART